MTGRKEWEADLAKSRTGQQQPESVTFLAGRLDCSLSTEPRGGRGGQTSRLARPTATPIWKEEYLEIIS